MTQPEFLVTNDDGILAYGLRLLVKALIPFGRVRIVAPRTEQSSIGTALTVRAPLYLQQLEWEEDVEVWTVTGTPCDCLKMALYQFYSNKKPALILSGVNAGSNAGRNIFSSGTVAATILGALSGVPSIAFSSIGYEKKDFELAATTIAPIVNFFLHHPIPKETLINVNTPIAGNLSFQGIKFATQGKGHYTDRPEERQHPDGHSYFWLGCQVAKYDEAQTSDVELLKQGYATVVPIYVGDLTAQSYFNKEQELFNQSMEKTINNCLQ